MLPGVSRPFRDWKPGGHGVVNLHRSIVVSCDTYYYGLANDLGVDAIHRFMTQFGFGSRTGVDIDGELPGLQPSTDWKWQRFKQKWYAGDTISVGIGQGYWLATPMQLAVATATLANGGTPVHPRLVRAVQDARTQQVRELPVRLGDKLAIRPEHVELVKAAMVDVTRPGGTAVRAAQGAPYLVGGKTGTAQVIGMKAGEKYDEKRVKERHRDHALFIAYAPADAPRIALALLVENGGHGGSTAAPIAREVLDYYLLGKRPERKLPLVAEEAEGD
jgi:penicillin-binding protein 2